MSWCEAWFPWLRPFCLNGCRFRAGSPTCPAAAMLFLRSLPKGDGRCPCAKRNVSRSARWRSGSRRPRERRGPRAHLRLRPRIHPQARARRHPRGGKRSQHLRRSVSSRVARRRSKMVTLCRRSHRFRFCLTDHRPSIHAASRLAMIRLRRLRLAVSRGWIIGDTASSRLLASRAPRGSLGFGDPSDRT